MSYQQHSLVPVDGGWIVAHRFAAGSEHPSPLSVPAAPLRCLLISPIGFAAEAIDPLARTLADEGIEVITFDLRNHVGESTGNPNSFLLSSAVRDCQAMLDAVRPQIVAAVGIASRVAARVLPNARTVEAAAFLTPVVDIDGTLEQRRRSGDSRAKSAACFFESNLNRPEIWDDARAHDLSTFESTIADLEQFTGTLHLVAGSDDPCARSEQIALLAGRLPGNPRIRTVETDRHLIDADIELGSRMLGALVDEVVAIANSHFRGSQPDESGPSANSRTNERPTWGTGSASLTASSKA